MDLMHRRDLEMTLTTVTLKLPCFARFLSHCCISCVGWQSVANTHCSLLHGDDFDPGSFSDEQQVPSQLVIRYQCC